MKIDNVEVKVTNGEMSEEELIATINELRKNNPNRVIKAIEFTLDGEFVDARITFAEQPFERIRRITGYLVGTLDRFNDGKRAEEADRVKHTLSK